MTERPANISRRIDISLPGSEINVNPIRLDGSSLFVPIHLAILICLVAATASEGVAQLDRFPSRQERQDEAELDRIPFDGRQAYEYLKEICEIGPRVSGTEGMFRQQAYLKEKFEAEGAKVEYQEWQVTHPETFERVTLRNMIVQWHPEQKHRILICAHYDTRPFPDQDPIDPTGPFIGANDGASGAALLLELGKHMKDLDRDFGVDFVLFDAEEFVFDRRRDPLFIGSTYFSEEYANSPPEYQYKYGVLVDMIGDKSLELFFEANSMIHARDLTRSIWNTARKLRVSEFIARTRHEVRDDHLPLNQIARIPTCDIIDFDYPSPTTRYSFWHTQDDTPDKCSAVSLAKVGWVLKEWIFSLE